MPSEHEPPRMGQRLSFLWGAHTYEGVVATVWEDGMVAIDLKPDYLSQPPLYSTAEFWRMVEDGDIVLETP